MEKIQPTLMPQSILCVEATAGPGALIVFGASGDLTRRKLLVSVFELFKRSLVSEQFYLLGAGRKKLSDEQFRQSAREDLDGRAKQRGDDEKVAAFVDRLYYISGDYGEESFYEKIKSRRGELDIRHKVEGHHVFYLAVPPFLYASITEGLCKASLSGRGGPADRSSRLVVEKPFGHDLASAAQLNEVIGECFDESQVYRIDHYLGKETVQNILIFRFANTMFEPVWNRNYIDHVQITIAETVGVEHRAGYYDKSGALRDMFQNHMLQMLALVAMEPPTSFEADRLRDEKVKLLRSVRRFKPEEVDKYVVRGQYVSGTMDGKEVRGYLEEEGVGQKSKTETYVAARMFIDNWRWKGVPFYLRTGKRLARRDTEIVITFKKIPHSMFEDSGLEDMPSNVLVLQIQPEEGIHLSFQAKRPGSKICIDTLNMDFNYSDVFGVEIPEAYQRLLLDCMVGDQTLFTRYDSVEIAWQLMAPVLEAWEKSDSIPLEYAAGGESFAEANRLIEDDGRTWHQWGAK